VRFKLLEQPMAKIGADAAASAGNATKKRRSALDDVRPRGMMYIGIIVP
jgi:hypothetical protein